MSIYASCWTIQLPLHILIKWGAHTCDALAKAIWGWAIPRNVWLSAAFVPGSQNHIADFKSRNFNDNTEWSLSPTLFDAITCQFFSPQVDLFVS